MSVIYSLLLPFDASGVVLGVLAGLRVAVRRAGVGDEDCATDVVGLAGERRGALALGVRGLVVGFVGVGVGVGSTPGVVSPLA